MYWFKEKVCAVLGHVVRWKHPQQDWCGCRRCGKIITRAAPAPADPETGNE